MIGAVGLLLPISASARWDFGGGMEYYTVQTYVRDLQGNYYQSLIQSTLGRARLGWQEGPFDFLVSGGWSDWQVSGGIRSNEIGSWSADAFYAGLHNLWDASAACRVWDGLEAGLAYEDHAVKQYKIDGFEMLSFRTQSAGAFLRYAPLKTPSVRVLVTAEYDPFVRLEFAQSTDFFSDQDLATIREYHSAANGTRWSGHLQLQYRDSAGWGIDARYTAGFARFPSVTELEECTLRYGALTGTISILF